MTMSLWQGQAGSLYLPPPSSPEAESVVPPSSSLVPVARSGDSAGDGDQHHHHQPGDPLGWLRDAIPGTASGHCVHLPSRFDVSKPTQSENPLQNVHLPTVFLSFLPPIDQYWALYHSSGTRRHAAGVSVMR